MTARIQTRTATCLAALLGIASGMLGCRDVPDGGVATSEGELASSNGLTMINGLSMTNGLTMTNGLSMTNGLTMTNGLASGSSLMSSATGRMTVSYLVRCALPANRSVTKKDQHGVSYTYPGKIGVAPEWETGACGTDCQQQVTACMLAHINTTGKHISIWLDSSSPAVGWGQNTDFPYQEGSFFGNIFVSPPKAYYCNGKDFDQGVVPGRLGAGQVGAPYTNGVGGDGYCKNHCVAADYPHGGDGYKSCNNYNHITTVWRNFDPNTAYKVCNRSTGGCLDVRGASTSDYAEVLQWHDTGTMNQQWKINQVRPGKYKFINANSNKVLDINGGWVGDGAQPIQFSYNGGSNQLWSFTPTGDGYYKFSPGSNLNASINVKNNNRADGAPLEQWTWNNWGSQQWKIVPTN